MKFFKLFLGVGLSIFYFHDRAAADPSWTLSTSDTVLTLSVVSNQPTITQLQDAATGWNWTPTARTVPLLSKAGGLTPNWTYQGAAVDTSSGTQVTLTFTSTSPNLTLTQVWSARLGPGPVEETTSVTNNGGASITINDTDVIAADLTVQSDGDVTLWQFDRDNENFALPQNDEVGFNTGTLKTSMGASTNVSSPISNDITPTDFSFVLPFIMLDVNSSHGLYIGYEMEFGNIVTSTSGNAHTIRNTFTLYNQYSFTEPAGAVFALPGMFFGAYKGDTDDGSNKMKKWFWTYKAPATLRDTPGEPPIMYPEIVGGSVYSLNAATTFLQNTPLASLGYEMMQVSEYWELGFNQSSNPWSWDPNPDFWPNGNYTLGTMLHNANLLFGLTMGETFAHNDLSTVAGVATEENALLTRYDKYHFDYWYSAYDELNGSGTGYYIAPEPYNYGLHEGLLTVVDYMIANRPAFRWVSESFVRGMKSFDALERQSRVSATSMGYSKDRGNGGGAEGFRKAYYSNSYMINPVQIQCDDATYQLPITTAEQTYNYRTAFFAAWIDAIANDTSANTFGTPLFKAHAALYKSQQRPILRGADVYHILPICDDHNWDGMEFYNTSLKKGSIILLKSGLAGIGAVAGNSPTIYLKGLNPTSYYTLTFQDRTSLNSTYVNVAGSSLMAGGSGIASFSGNPNDFDSEIIWISESNSTVAPAITSQPVSETVTSGSTVVFNVTASGTPTPTYQWMLNNAAISGATGSRLLIQGATSANAGSYTVVVTNSAGSATSNAATLSFTTTSNPGRLVNLSVLTNVQGTLAAGFVIGGSGTSGSENLLIRATGPALTAFGVGSVLPDPTLTVTQQSNHTTVASNAGWGSNQTAVTQADNAVGAFALTDPTSKDSALVQSLAEVSGGYSAQIKGASGDSGNALTEVYDDTASYTLSTPRLVNLSCLTSISAGGSLSAGFVIGGTTAKTVLVRATGPALTAFGVGGVMADPQIVVRPLNSSTVLAANAGWGGDSQITAAGNAVGAFGLTDPSSKDSAVLLTLAPGPYTAQVSSVGGGGGNALVEVYEVP